MTQPTNDSPHPEPPETPQSPGAQTIQAAPAVVKRSMPMALSILLGILLAGLAAWFFRSLIWFILLLYLSFVAATILEKPVHWLTRHHIRRGLAATLIMVSGLAVIVGIALLIANSVYTQATALSQQIAKAPDRINSFVKGIGNHFPHFASDLQSFDISEKISHSLPSFATVWQNTIAGFIILSYFVVAFFIVLYMLVDGPSHLKGLRGLLPKSSRLHATLFFRELVHAHRSWALASLINVTSATILMSTGLFFLGVPGAPILGFLAGLGELIPNVGPFFGALPALLVAFLIDSRLFLYVAGMFVVLQTIQSYTITPKILKISIKLPVLATIISVLVMTALFGILGILAAIPLVTDLVVSWNYLAERQEKDPTDYDCANTPSDGSRDSIPHDPSPNSRLQKLFQRRHRPNPKDGPSSPSAAPGLDHLEKTEQRAAPPPADPPPTPTSSTTPTPPAASPH